MYNQPYFIPGYFTSAPSIFMRGAMNGTMGRALGGTMNGALGLASQNAGRGLGLFSRLGNSMKAIKGINWGGLITNASKTLNVVNQAIPLVRQVGPMVNNVKSMLRVASIFKDETDQKPIKKVNNSVSNKISNNNYVYNTNLTNSAKDYVESNEVKDYDSNYSDNSPTFFISS